MIDNLNNSLSLIYYKLLVCKLWQQKALKGSHNVTHLHLHRNPIGRATHRWLWHVGEGLCAGRSHPAHPTLTHLEFVLSHHHSCWIIALIVSTTSGILSQQ